MVGKLLTISSFTTLVGKASIVSITSLLAQVLYCAYWLSISFMVSCIFIGENTLIR